MNYKRIHRHYAYTLQGWIKDINGYRVDINSTGVYDIGEDGSNTNYVNKRFGRDLFSSMIQFYQTDYSPISGNNYFNLVSTNSIDLYNGNISAISVGIKDLNPLLKSYRYDKINRIKEMKSAGLNNNVWVTLTNLFGSTYSYDFNGNIESLIRYDENGNVLHNISYTYSADRNRLSSINVTGTGIGSSSYQYDALGNLIRDNNENINVTWNVIGKVKSVQTPNNMLSFAYNPFGQRQIKRTASDSTYYIHDATGNVMSIYVKDYPKISAIERPIYGSSRLGIMNKAVVFNMTGSLVSKSNNTIGIKEYELSDHLGNVSVVVLDRKYHLGDQFIPDAISQTDYYPFGYPITSRSYNSGYRYGFNGKEYDNEIYNASNFQDYGMRMYDTRIARFWGVDPLKNDYPFYSTFQFAGNKPIQFIDLDGKEEARFEELTYAILNPINALQARNNAEKAFQAAQNSGLPNPGDGLQDAFRHAYWNALNTRDIGVDNAEQIATLHEKGFTNPANDPNSPEYDPVAIEMDLFNNRIGRMIGSQYPNATDEQLAALVMQALANGELRVIINIGSDNLNKKIGLSNHPTLKAGSRIVKEYKPTYNEYNGTEDAKRQKKMEKLPKSGTGADNSDNYSGKPVENTNNSEQDY